MSGRRAKRIRREAHRIATEKIEGEKLSKLKQWETPANPNNRVKESSSMARILVWVGKRRIYKNLKRIANGKPAIHRQLETIT